MALEEVVKAVQGQIPVFLDGSFQRGIDVFKALALGASRVFSFRKYMTFKKDYNELVLCLLNGLVKDALRFEEIVSGSTSGLIHIDVKIEELQHKVKDVCMERCLGDNLSALRS
ncbi:hypothetical protein Ancab_039166 [Ancistrocladus abbreviatus]